MANQIESISQGNYILHNIDAKKLYVQEPLFTANSGDAVYVGWRPDETVLFDNGTTATKSATLSEPITNFNKIGVLYGDDHYGHRYIEADTDYPFAKWITNFGFDGWSTANKVGFREMAWSANNDKIYAVVGWQKEVPLTTTGNWAAGQSATFGGIIRVIGINRKENA